MNEEIEYFEDLLSKARLIAKTTYYALSILIVYMELMLVFTGANFLQVADTIQFMSLYFFELIPLMYVRKIKQVLTLLKQNDSELHDPR